MLKPLENRLVPFGSDSRRRARLTGVALVALVGLFTVLPILFVIYGSFNVAGVGQPVSLGVGAWIEGFRSARTVSSIGYSLLLALRAPAAAVIGFVIAWFLIRAEIPGKRFIELALWVAFFLPALPVAIAWSLLLDADYGLLNDLFMQLPFVDGPLFDIQSVMGIIWVHMTLATVPIMVILLAPALRQLDATYEQAARVCGAGNVRTLRDVTAPVLSTSVVAAAVAGLIRGLEAFEVEQLLGTPAGIYVYATRVYELMILQPPRFAQAMALSSVFLVILFALAVAYQVYSERRSYATISGRGVSFSPVRLGRLRFAASGVLFLYVGVGVFLPLFVLVAGSFMTLFGFFHVDDPFTASHWTRVVGDATFLRAGRNSLVLGILVPLIGLAVYTLLAYVIARSRVAGRQVLSVLVWLPWAVPGILLGVALLWVMFTVPGLRMLYGTLGALVLALVIQGLPLGVQMCRSAISRVGIELEQAARVCGAKWSIGYLTITIPLIAPMLVSVFVLTFAVVLRDISTSVLLASASSRPLSLLMLEYAVAGYPEASSVIGVLLSCVTIVAALVARRVGVKLGGH